MMCVTYFLNGLKIDWKQRMLFCLSSSCGHWGKIFSKWHGEYRQGLTSFTTRRVEKEGTTQQFRVRSMVKWPIRIFLTSSTFIPFPLSGGKAVFPFSLRIS